MTLKGFIPLVDKKLLKKYYDELFLSFKFIILYENGIKCGWNNLLMIILYLLYD